MSVQLFGTSIAHLQIGKEDPVLEGKVYRKWISKNPLEMKEHAFCCIIIDRQGHAIQDTMDLRDLRLFDSKLKINRAYRITNFICEPTSPYMQTLENKISLSFGKITSFTELSGQESEFPDHYFEFTPYAQLPSRIPYRDEETAKMVYPRLTDYLGCIRSISDLIPFGSASTRQRVRRNVAIEDLDGNMLELTIWGDLATYFNKTEYDKVPFPAVIAVTSCTVSRYRGTPQLATTSATHYYINPRTEEAATAYRMFKEKYAAQPPLALKIYQSDDPAEETNRNRQTLETLIQQNPVSLQNIRFTCEATLTSIITNRGWNYASCTECNTASTKVGATYVCKNHGKQIPTPYRYNFKATATDGTTNAEFTFFTDAGEKITGISCSDLRQKCIDSGQLQIPKELTDIVGKNHIFQIQFASGSQKEAGRFIVKDILDMPSKTSTQVPALPTTTEKNRDKNVETEAATSATSAADSSTARISTSPDLMIDTAPKKDKQQEPEELTTTTSGVDDSTTHTSSRPGTPPADVISTVETPTISTVTRATTKIHQQKEHTSAGTSNPKEKKPSAKRSLNEDLLREAKKKKDN